MGYKVKENLSFIPVETLLKTKRSAQHIYTRLQGSCMPHDAVKLYMVLRVSLRGINLKLDGLNLKRGIFILRGH